ncbi:MAG: ClC family H(+)/Cl(-) exchange transporter, partial [Clostridia bacterium]|nr:ClC family H(+)/Cl(-) exchange transporter [Clostridia bacterium]
VWQGALIGLLSGAVTILYRILLGFAETWRSSFLSNQSPVEIGIWFLILIVIAWLVSIFLKREPFIGGSGIPQVEGEYHGHFQQNPWKVLLYKIAGGFLCILGGLSLGREGPSIQLGAMGAKAVYTPLKRDEDENRILLLCGAAAGLSAAFNAPLAGVLFAIEEVHKKVSPTLLFAVMVSSVTADFCSKLVFGLNPVFSFPEMTQLSLEQYWILFVLGIVLGVSGFVFNRALLFSQKIFGLIKQPFLRLLISLVLAGIFGFIFPQVLGGGHHMIELLTGKKLTLIMIVVLLVAKFLFSVISFGSGAPGGIFFPLLVQGAYIGALCGNLAVPAGMVSAQTFFSIVIMSMAGFFTAIVHAPLTGIVLLCEMTGSFGNLLPVTMVCIVSYLVSNLLKNRPIYDSLLERMLNKD